MSLRIIDVSQWQSNFVTDADGIICKATEGTGFVDPTCDTKYQMNNAAGKCLGVYHFARPDLCSAVDEARFFVNNVKGYIGEALLALDWEQPNTQGNVSWAKAWLDEVNRLTGIKPLIYMSASVVNQYDWSSVAKADYGLWIAGYPDNRDSWDVPDFPYSTGAWNGCAMWQFTSSNGVLDRDIFFGDKNAWKAYATSKGSVEPAPAPVRKTNEELANEVIDGKWGNGADRKNRLEMAGYDYSAVQALVNQKLGTNNRKYYTIQSGDTLSEISSKFGTSIDQLCAWNGIANPSLIYAGDTIRVK